MSEDEKTKAADAATEDKGAPKSEPDKSKETKAAVGEDDDDLKDLTPEQMRKKILEARSESKKRREESKSAKEEAKVAREEAATLKKAKDDEELEKKKKAGEWEEVAKQKDEQLSRANERIIRAELRLIAQTEGILDPSDVNTISLEGLTIDDKGDVHGAEKAVKKLKADKPHYFKPAEDANKKKEEEKPKGTSSAVTEPPKGKSGSTEELSHEERKKNFMAVVRARR